MYEPAGREFLKLAFLWPAFAAASASDMAAQVATRFAELAIGLDERPAHEPGWTTAHAVALELPSVRLRDFSTDAKCPPALVCAPLTLHRATIADLAPGHSLVAALREAGLRHLFLADWRSATAQTRLRGIDDYLADFNVLVDEIGAPLDLIGICQGGWMALMYAARFPGKVRKLVLAGAPIDTAAAPSALSVLADASPLAMFHQLVRLGDGLLQGSKLMQFWGPQSIEDEDVHEVLQTEEPIGSAAFAELKERFANWYSWTIDLPGPFFLETVEKLYKRNELANGSFTALGKRIDLAAVTVPIFFLAARDDELVAPAQLFATERLVGTSPRQMRRAVAPCRHAGLFFGKRTLEDLWPRLVRWLGGKHEMLPRQVGALEPSAFIAAP